MCYGLSLSNFNKLVPEVRTWSKLAKVLELFRGGDEEIVVVVNEQRSLQGAINYRGLINMITQEKSLKSPAEIGLADIIEPINSLPGVWTVEEFCVYLNSEKKNPAEWNFALVDEKEQFLGILDHWKLLKTLVEDREPQTLQEKLLEQLPLPLLWQDQQGRTLGQNAQWRLQLGDFAPSKDLAQVKLKRPRAYQRSLLSDKREFLDFPYCVKDSYRIPTLRSQLILGELLLEIPESRDVSTAELLETRPILTLPETKPPQERVWEFERVVVDSLIPKVFYLIIATDITEEQRLSTEVAAKTADLFLLNRLKDEFLSCISHELKSPLTAILGLSSLLKDQKLGELNSRQARYSELIYQSGRQLMSLVNDLLDLTRLESGQLKLTLEQVKIKAVSDRVYQGLKEKHKEKITQELEYTLEIDPQVTSLMADEMRLRQMLTHLLDNAVKFTPQGGKIGLRVSHWDKWIAFTVWDTGIAIPIESQHLLFEKFQQLENPLTRQFEGTGLGLVLTQRLAKVHGGDISFISQEGQGSEFTILLPSHPERLTTKDNHPATPTNQLILIVETIPRYIERLTSQLQDLQYRFVIARTGTEAINKARQLQPLMILLNPVLPLLSGWDVLTLIKSHPRTQHIPVIITSNPEDKQKALQQGVEGFLSIPIETKSLAQILTEGHNNEANKYKKFTVLYLRPNFNDESLTKIDLGLVTQLSGSIHRFLESDDLEQAEILAQFWQIDVILFDGSSLTDSLTTLKVLSESESLAHLPLVTLDIKTTQAANKISSLSVFPCLVPLSPNTLNNLLKVIEIAVGIK